MKKIFKVIICLCLTLACSLTFFACDLSKNDKFYEETNAAFNEFIEKVCNNPKYSDGLTYGEHISAIIEKIDNDTIGGDNLFEYSQLKDIYDKIFINSFSYLDKFNDVFLNVPNELTTGTKKAYRDFEKQLKDVQNAINDLDSKVLNMDINIGGSTQEIATKDISIQYVRNFKRDYIAVSKKLINLCSSLVNLCETYIYPQVNEYYTEGNYIELSTTQLVNQRTIAVLKSAINTLSPAIKYLEAFNGNYTKLSTDNFIDILTDYLDLVYDNESTITIEKLDVWNNIYKAYMIELDCFYTSLDKIDFEDLRKNYSYNLDNYAKQNTDKKPYVQKVQTFSQNRIVDLYNVVEDICD